MATQRQGTVTTLERGRIYFFYRPRVEEHEPESRSDIQQLYLLFSPSGADRPHRLAVIGRARLPEPSRRGGQRYWGFIDMVERRPEAIVTALKERTYTTKTRGERHLPAARPAGSGVYRILRHDDHTHLVYALGLPQTMGPVQEALHIQEEASYIISIKNPDKPSPPRTGLPRRDEAHYPKRLKEVFRDRKFADLDPPELVDYEGAELVLIGAAEDPEQELGVQVGRTSPGRARAGIFDELRLDESEQPSEPLFRGEWA